MKSASFKYVGSPRSNRVETVYGKVTLKDNGKISITGLNSYGGSYAAKYAAKLLAQEIVKADFNHPAAYDIKSSENSNGLLAQLISMTKDFKADYIQKVKEAAARMFENYQKQNARSYQEWMEIYSIAFEMKKNYDGSLFPSPIQMDKRFYSMRNKMLQAMEIVKGGFEKYEASEVKYAEAHFASAMEKLAYRLNQKGIVDGSNFEIKSARVGVNIEMLIYHGNEITKAWTIVAEGPIQRAHFRYLIK